jgi:hypothetical protein
MPLHANRCGMLARLLHSAFIRIKEKRSHD